MARSPAGLAAHRRLKHAAETEFVGDTEPSGDSPFAADAEPTKANGKTKKTLRELLGLKPKADAQPKTPKEPKPKRWLGGNRESGADLLGMPWGFAGRVMAPARPVTARMLELQAPYAGHVLDEAVARTIVDRIAIQPIARAQDRLGAGAAVLGPPLCTMNIEKWAIRLQSATSLEQAAKCQAAIQTWTEALKESIRMAAPYIGRGIAAKKAADAELAKILAELYPSAPEGSTTLDLMVQDILRPLYEQPPASPAQPQEAPANV